jgi:hypothetical protein
MTLTLWSVGSTLSSDGVADGDGHGWCAGAVDGEFRGGLDACEPAVDAVTLDAARSVSAYAAVSTHVIIDVVGYVTGPSSPVSQTGLSKQTSVTSPAEYATNYHPDR